MNILPRKFWVNPKVLSVSSPSLDGRCFLCSLTTGLDDQLQRVVRAHRVITSPLLRLKEAAKVDKLRNSMILCTLLDFEQSQSRVKDALNADLPADIPFESLQERMEVMAQPTTHVGEFEILQTAKVIGTKIIALQSDAELHITKVQKRR